MLRLTDLGSPFCPVRFHWELSRNTGIFRNPVVLDPERQDMRPSCALPEALLDWFSDQVVDVLHLRKRRHLLVSELYRGFASLTLRQAHKLLLLLTPGLSIEAVGHFSRSILSGVGSWAMIASLLQALQMVSLARRISRWAGSSTDRKFFHYW